MSSIGDMEMAKVYTPVAKDGQKIEWSNVSVTVANTVVTADSVSPSMKTLLHPMSGFAMPGEVLVSAILAVLSLSL
jgi:hypothetical protein